MKPPTRQERIPTIRRDDRAEPDDSEPVERVDVVPPSSPGGNVLVHLRRELAKLSQQAAAVERSIEQQSRDREETADKLDRANERIILLEARLGSAESEAHSMRRLHETALEELNKIRDERDALAKDADVAKAASEELARTKAEVERLRVQTEDASKSIAALEGQLAEVRKKQFQEALRVTDKESEVIDLRQQVERAEAERAEAKKEVDRLKADAAKARFEAVEAREAAAKLREEVSRVQADASARVEAAEQAVAKERAEREEALAPLRKDLEAAQTAEADVRAVNARLKRELEAASAEREAAENRGTRLEGELAELKLDHERMRRELDEALDVVKDAESRAATAERTFALLTQSMLDLREQISSGFARAGVGGSPISSPALPSNLGPPVPHAGMRPSGAPKPPPLPAMKPEPPPPSVKPAPLPTLGSSKGAIPSIRPVYNDDDD